MNSFQRYSKHLSQLLFTFLLLASPLFAQDLKDTIAKHRDKYLQCGLEELIAKYKLEKSVSDGQAALAVADISSKMFPRYAGINSTKMLYAASLPKIAILYAVLKKAELGKLDWNADVQNMAEAMIQHSSNKDATSLFYLAGPDFINELLASEDFYNLNLSGGIWVGKEYGKGMAWERDTECTLSHGANALQIVRFYYLLDAGKLLSSSWTSKAKQILGASGLNHKFTKGLKRCCQRASVLRKSGSWSSYHADSVLVEYRGRRYIVAALLNHASGDKILEDLIIDINRLIHTYRFEKPACSPRFQ